jgi:hypothetical protein
VIHIDFRMEHVMSKRCKACGCLFHPRPQVPDQSYCPVPECQRERRRRWQQQKRQGDPHYRENDVDHYKAWAATNPDYWKRYRDSHPGYADRNRSLQQDRNRRQPAEVIANEGASTPVFSLPSGRYRIIPIMSEGIANEDAWIVEITVISSGCDDSGD